MKIQLEPLFGEFSWGPYDPKWSGYDREAVIAGNSFASVIVYEDGQAGYGAVLSGVIGSIASCHTQIPYTYDNPEDAAEEAANKITELLTDFVTMAQAVGALE